MSNILGALELPFSPIRLILLIAWVYLCLYSVQRVQFSAIVTKNYKSIANIAALFIGPLFLLVLFVMDIVRKSAQSKGGVGEVLKQKMHSIFGHLLPSQFGGSHNDSGIELLDLSGRDIGEVYSYGGGKREDNYILSLTRQVISDAIEERASDLLIDPKDDATYTIRFRVDGVLRTVDYLDAETCKPVVNSLKAVANMDIAETRRPQDGAFVARTSDGTVSFRVASAGVRGGEKISIRVLHQDVGKYTLINVGLTEKQRLAIQQAIEKPAGMILMCGPTGSGKTTTLYAMLNMIDLYTRNVITVEDPIEYVFANASQIEVNPKAGITFAKTLRSILRQDPDVICVGEIRDEETASIALRAAQTGHLVLATVHSDSNASALIRLLDLGVTPALLASGLNMIVSQRLLRSLCEHCKAPADLSRTQIVDMRKKQINYKHMYKAVGCEKCGQTGYYGRIGIFDILTLDEKIKIAIATNKMLIDGLRKEGSKKGRSNLQKQGLKKVVSGLTSLSELKRVVG